MEELLEHMLRCVEQQEQQQHTAAADLEAHQQQSSGVTAEAQQAAAVVSKVGQDAADTCTVRIPAFSSLAVTASYSKLGSLLQRLLLTAAPAAYCSRQPLQRNSSSSTAGSSQCAGACRDKRIPHWPAAGRASKPADAASIYAAAGILEWQCCWQREQFLWWKQQPIEQHSCSSCYEVA
jgi:hypothetical protein